MVVNSLCQTENKTLARVSLLCTIIALDVSNSIFQTTINNNEEPIVDYEYYLTNILFNYHFNFQSGTALREIALLLVQTSNVTFKYENISMQKDSQEIEIERFKQYLRKFTFFFHKYIQYYPNELSTLSIKKTNMLAIKNLFFISGL